MHILNAVVDQKLKSQPKSIAAQQIQAKETAPTNQQVRFIQ